MKKRISVISLMFLFTIMIAFTGCASSPKRITGNEWLLKQEECLDDLEAFCKGMDDVYTLYVIEAITADDFKNEVNLLLEQYQMMLSVYDELEQNNPIEPETHSYLSRTGTESLKKVYDTIYNTLSASFDENGNVISTQEVSYMYISQKQVLQSHLSGYCTAVAWLRAANGEWDENAPLIGTFDESYIPTT